MATHEYVAVTNIPSSFHTADLRAHFSSLVEDRAFVCFHFRHRPEKINSDSSETPRFTELKRCCVVKVLKTRSQQLLKHNGQHWTDVHGEIRGDICHTSAIKLKSSSKSECEPDAVEETMLLQMPELRPPELMPNGNVGTPTLVFLDYIQRCLLPQTLVHKLQLKFPKTAAKRIYGNVNFDYGTHDQSDISESGDTTVKHFELLGKPPLSLRQLCKEREKIQADDSFSGCSKDPCNNIPEKESDGLHHVTESNIVIRPQTSSLHPDGAEKSPEKDSVTEMTGDSKVSSTTASSDPSVNIDATVGGEVDSESPLTLKQSQCYCQNISSGAGKSESDMFVKPTVSLSEAVMKESKELSNRERKRKERDEKRQMRKLMAEGIEERLIAIEKRYHNDDDAEEWDRHEASEDDPSNQERNKERLYEEEIEQPWEKGGPGVVFYTDAMYWQEKEGDFDEQTTDDLDVDFSAYEESGAGDKDIKDFLKIRQERRFRSGYDKTDRFSIGIGKRLQNPRSKFSSSGSDSSSVSRIGAFEHHSKGIGRKVMEKQGWREGQGLGSSRPGITEALRAEGQRPHNKRGLGYVEEEPVTFGPGRIKTRREQPHLITTVYDDPKSTDPKEPLLQRSEPSTLKHRQSHREQFS